MTWPGSLPKGSAGAPRGQRPGVAPGPPGPAPWTVSASASGVFASARCPSPGTSRPPAGGPARDLNAPPKSLAPSGAPGGGEGSLPRGVTGPSRACPGDRGFRHLGAQPHELAQGNLCLRVASLKSQGPAQVVIEGRTVGPEGEWLPLGEGGTR